MLGLGFQSGSDDLLDFVVIYAARCSAARHFAQSGGSVLEETLAPFSYGRRAEIGPAHNFCVGQTFGGPKDHLGTQNFQMPGAATAYCLLQGLFFLRSEF